jgi:hypothetical protein
VAPAVVDAVAAHIKIPDRGAIITPPSFQLASRCIKISLMSEAFIIPAKAPVPIRSIAIEDIFSNP